MSRRALTLTVLVVVAAACGSDESGEPSDHEPTVASTTATQADERTTAETTATIEDAGTEAAPDDEPQRRRLFQMWFTQGDLGLELAWLEAPSSEAVGAEALRYLLEGASVLIGKIPGVGVPAGAGPFTLDPLDSQIPHGTRLIGLDIDAGLATVDLSSRFTARPSLRSRTYAIGQIVYTLTQFPTVRTVRFRVEGRPLPVPSGKGVTPERDPSRTLLRRPVSRADYADLLPPIVVESPAWGERVTSPLRVAGTANVFEANVTFRVLDARGRQLARTFTTAACGSGCRGAFQHRVEFRVRVPQRGVLVAQDDDADGDGFPSHSVRVPLLLAP